MTEKQLMDRVFRDQPYHLTSPFNMKRVHPITGEIRPHWGNDYGTYGVLCPLYSPIWGKVVRSQYYGERGHFVEIKCKYGSALLQHLQYRSVKVGQYVHQNVRIGGMGNTGLSSAAHLHIEFYDDNHNHISPAEFFAMYKDPVFPRYVVFGVGRSYLNVRNKPSIAGSIVGKKKSGEVVPVYWTSETGWKRVFWSKAGYCSPKFLRRR